MIKDLLVKDKMFFNNNIFIVNKDKQEFYIFNIGTKYFEKHTLLDKNDYICNDLLRKMCTNFIVDGSSETHFSTFINNRYPRTYRDLKNNFFLTGKLFLYVHMESPSYYASYGIGSSHSNVGVAAYIFKSSGYIGIRGNSNKKDFVFRNKQDNIFTHDEYTIINNRYLLFTINGAGETGTNAGYLAGVPTNTHTIFARDFGIYDTVTRTFTISNVKLFQQPKYCDINTHIFNLPTSCEEKPHYRHVIHVTKEEWENNPLY